MSALDSFAAKSGLSAIDNIADVSNRWHYIDEWEAQMRALVGFLIAPLPTALFQSLIVALQPKGGPGIYQHPSSMFVAIALYFYSLGLLVGVPILLFTRKRGNYTLGRYSWVTALIMLLPVTVAMAAWTMNGNPSLYAVAYIVSLFGLGGAVAGSLFWWIAKRSKHQEAATKIFG